MSDQQNTIRTTQNRYAADTHVVDALHSLVRFLGSEEYISSMLANQKFDLYDPQSCMVKPVECSKIASIEGAVTYVHDHVEVVLFEPEKSLKVTGVRDHNILSTLAGHVSRSITPNQKENFL